MPIPVVGGVVRTRTGSSAAPPFRWGVHSASPSRALRTQAMSRASEKRTPLEIIHLSPHSIMSAVPLCTVARRQNSRSAPLISRAAALLECSRQA
eukprot:4909520-Alexandrium_andersonii.AAC.1